MNSRCFYSLFPEFSPKFSSIVLKFNKIFENSVVDYIFKDKQALLIVLIQFFGKNFWINITKFSLFHQKRARNKLL